MKKHILLTISVFILMATSALAVDDNAPKTGTSTTNGTSAQTVTPEQSSPKNKDWSLDEARKYAHNKVERAQKYASKLDKMTEAEWAEFQKKRHSWKEKWSKMTAEEKQAMKAKWNHLRQEKADEQNAAPVKSQ